MSVAANDLNTAEIAYAAIQEVDKVQFINSIKSIPTEEGRSAELCLFRRRPEEAEVGQPLTSHALLHLTIIFRACTLASFSSQCTRTRCPPSHVHVHTLNPPPHNVSVHIIHAYTLTSKSTCTL